MSHKGRQPDLVYLLTEGHTVTHDVVLPQISNQHTIKPLGLPPVHRRPRGQRRVLTDTERTSSARASGEKLHGTNGFFSKKRDCKKKERERNRWGRKIEGTKGEGEKKVRGDNKI